MWNEEEFGEEEYEEEGEVIKITGKQRAETFFGNALGCTAVGDGNTSPTTKLYKFHHLLPTAGADTGWDTWEFFPGPTALGGPWGPIGREFFFFSFKKREN